MRQGEQPNLRVQDGETRPWFCGECEQTIGVWETRFATDIFYPYNADRAARLGYADWMLKFCVSVSWRALMMRVDDGHVRNLSDAQRAVIPAALETWQKFLRGAAAHPGRFEQHLLPIDEIGRATTDGLPPNINRYLLRAIDVDPVSGTDAAFIYTKFGRFILVGHIDVARPKDWSGTKVHVRSGIIEPRAFGLPGNFYEYLTHKAVRYADIYERISDKQKAKIDAAYRGNMDRVRASETMKAMAADVRLFGSDAFDPNGD